jgi:V/A-type H+-transporting ATPase subunit B
MMSLKVNISLEKALDRGWEILASCFTPEETGIKKSVVEAHWPSRVS